MLLVTVAIVASLMQAQAFPDTAPILGAVISSYNERPLAGVMIAAPEVHKFVVTDADGRFALGGLPAGKRAIRVS